MNGDNNEWNTWSKHVLFELERFDKDLQTINKSINKVHVEIATLKVKSGVWGMIGATIPLSVAFLVHYLSK